MMKSVRIRHVESGKEFDSIKAASTFFKIDKCYVNGRRRFKEGLAFERLPSEPDSNGLRIPNTDEPETFKSIPGYEGLYSISSKGRVRCDKFSGRFKKYSTTKSNQHIVVLSKNSQPHSHTVESLYYLTWHNTPISKSPFHADKSKAIQCLDDHRIFKSQLECTSYYHIDYSKFIKASKTAESGIFSYREHTFMFL